jgi:hypothetical protein
VQDSFNVDEVVKICHQMGIEDYPFSDGKDIAIMMIMQA